MLDAAYVWLWAICLQSDLQFLAVSAGLGYVWKGLICAPKPASTSPEPEAGQQKA